MAKERGRYSQDYEQKQANCPLPSTAQFWPFTVTVTLVPKVDRVWVWPLCVFLYRKVF